MGTMIPMSEQRTAASSIQGDERELIPDSNKVQKFRNAAGQ